MYKNICIANFHDFLKHSKSSWTQFLGNNLYIKSFRVEIVLNIQQYYIDEQSVSIGLQN